MEAIHLAIALAYHGLLRVPSRIDASDYDLCECHESNSDYYSYSYSPVYVYPTSVAALNLSSLIHRYVRPFTKHDAQHALQYVACICLSADQGNGVGKEQVEYAWAEVRKIIVLAEGAGWDEFVGGLRPDGSRFVSYIVTDDIFLLIIPQGWYN